MQWEPTSFCSIQISSSITSITPPNSTPNSTPNSISIGGRGWLHFKLQYLAFLSQSLTDRYLVSVIFRVVFYAVIISSLAAHIVALQKDWYNHALSRDCYIFWHLFRGNLKKKCYVAIHYSFFEMKDREGLQYDLCYMAQKYFGGNVSIACVTMEIWQYNEKKQLFINWSQR